MKVTEESQQIFQKSVYPEELKAIVDYTDNLVTTYQIEPTELQWTILINHLNEMILRQKEGTTIPTVDPEMFNEVSKEAMQISRNVVEKIGGLAEDEIYVLSIHFESAKQN
ncbi:PRD domain-containing protein [Enterococcus florum]|uniref:PRD domain-containing protein n=1 Tax=Enterococcus florum TaxID=2480627 RepID=A0A4P5P3W6_9ENTE|nr:PRD domain-containing protein [Enterococcus florum]GCF92280.1 PRD domain-containing protein [Enterococcus florum]